MSGQKWQIDYLSAPTSFAGLGQLKNCSLSAGKVAVLQNEGEILAIPAISGSEKTKTEAKDTDILLEIASFAPEKVARSSFALNYRSESSKLWAGGVRPELQDLALVHLARILQEQGIEFELEQLVDWQREGGNALETGEKENLSKTEIELDLEYLAQRLDARDLDYWQKVILEKLQFLGKVEEKNGKFVLYPNPFYTKLQTQPDILEQLVRLIGFDNLEPQNLQIDTGQKINLQTNKLLEIKKFVTQFGFSEVILRPFISENWLISALSASISGSENSQENFEKNSGKIASGLRVLNPYNSGRPVLRDSLLPSLLETLSDNLRRGHKEPKIFELNEIYSFNKQNKQIQSDLHLSLVCVHPDPYLNTTLLQELGRKMLCTVSPQKLDSRWQALGQGFSFDLSKKEEEKSLEKDQKEGKEGENQDLNHRAVLLELSNKLKKQFDLPLQKKIWFLDILLRPENLNFYTYRQYQDESDFPKIERSYSFFCPKEASWQQVLQVLESSLFEDCQIQFAPTERLASEKGEKTDKTDILNFRVEFVSYSRTLNSQEILAWEEKTWPLLAEIGLVPRS